MHHTARLCPFYINKYLLRLHSFQTSQTGTNRISSSIVIVKTPGLVCSQKSSQRKTFSYAHEQCHDCVNPHSDTQFSAVMALVFRFGLNKFKIVLKVKSRNSRRVIRLIPRKKPNVPPKLPVKKKWDKLELKYAFCLQQRNLLKSEIQQQQHSLDQEFLCRS